MTFETLLTEEKAAVAIITLNRPKALNAINAQMVSELNAALDAYDGNDAIRCIVITGNEKAFAAGADVREMKDHTKATAHSSDFLKGWDHIGTINTPIIAAVAGYCMGGGMELALACDFIIAADTAKFALPEITLGILPGVGGTQRLTHGVGKAKAMDMILTGRSVDANEATHMGFVSRVVSAESLMGETLQIAEKIAGSSSGAVQAAKRAISAALELPLAAGIKREREIFYARFDDPDQKEGMAAFLEKRKPVFRKS